MSPLNSSSSSSPSLWVVSGKKLHFFTRIRRYLQSKVSSRRRCGVPSRTNIVLDGEIAIGDPEDAEGDSEDDAVVLQKSVKRLHFGNWEEKEKAAGDIERFAREDVKTRKLMAELGVIQMLVSMVDSDGGCRRQAALKALIALANGTFTNKALMLDAGILSKLPNNIDVVEESTKGLFTELLLSLSLIANTRFSLASSEILPFVIGVLESGSRAEIKELCLSTLYNLSSLLENAGPLVSNGAVHTLLSQSSIKEISEKALATLGHLVVTLMGKKAMEDSPMVPKSLIEALTWDDRPKCQELSAYILMILAHQSSSQREKMAKAGIVPVLLEVSLLGSPLAQKRAMKLLQWFKDERHERMGPHSGPQTGRILALGSPVSPREGQKGKKMMKSLVKQSLYKNMEMITRRANATGAESSKSLVISTSSKSLPY